MTPLNLQALGAAHLEPKPTSQVLRSVARKAPSAQVLATLLGGFMDIAATQAEHNQLCHALAECYLQLGHPRLAMSVAWYSGDLPGAETYAAKCPPIDRGVFLFRYAEQQATLGALGRSAAAGGTNLTAAAAQLEADADRAGQGPPAEAPFGALVLTRYRQAAALFQKHGRFARAAIAFEKAGDAKRASTCWGELAKRPAPTAEAAYHRALAAYNVYRVSGKRPGERDEPLLAHGVRELEKAARQFLEIGRRERAFDVFQVLAAVGQLSEHGEHQLEGLLNAIQILESDQLRRHALRLYQEAIQALSRRDEQLAVLALCQRYLVAANRFDNQRHRAEAKRLLRKAWQDRVDSLRALEGETDQLRQALIQLAEACVHTRDYAAAAISYEELASTSTTEAQKRYFRSAVQRFQSNNAPSRLRQQPMRPPRPFPPVWLDDLVEQGNGSRLEDHFGDVLFNQMHVAERGRRLALLARLAALYPHDPAHRLERSRVILRCVEQVQLYGMLAPVEVLASHRDTSIRIQVFEVLASFRFRRTFHALEQGLLDNSALVRVAAEKALSEMSFGHGVEPLCRLYRSATRQSTKEACLRGLAKVEEPVARRFLREIYHFGGAEERKLAARVLQDFPQARAAVEAP